MSFATRCSQLRLWQQPLQSAVRHFTTGTATLSPKQYVRIAGPSCYASSSDIVNFLNEQSIHVNKSVGSLVQGQSDIYQNHSVWVYNADNQANAEQIVSKISGKVLGLKLIRAAAIDQKIVNSMLNVQERPGSGRVTLRKRLNLIAPAPDERGRTLLASNLPHLLQPRHLWSFFSNYEVVDVKHLRRSGVACVIFSSQKEAERALRERANLHLHGKQIVYLKMHQ
ncbi:RNA recognition motif [Gracilaria domingensis]|nr:RNA recognition motif [Gracilaria domingensis]